MNEWTGNNTNAFSVMSRQAVREFDRRAVEQFGVPSVVLMENAGRNGATLILELYPDILGKTACIFCGGGNNGGDGFVIARHLFNAGVAVKIVLCADAARLKGDAKTNYQICRNMQIPIDTLDMASEKAPKEIENHVHDCALLVDALFGTGLKGELKSSPALLISCLNAHNLPIIAVDIPSGMDCDTGLPLPVCIEAQATVTFAALKKGFVECPESRTAAGRVFVADIGITPASLPES